MGVVLIFRGTNRLFKKKKRKRKTTPLCREMVIWPESGQAPAG